MANEPKPLMIRGDRLLLLLDVLAFLSELVRCRTPPTNPKGFSRRKTLRLLSGRFGLRLREWQRFHRGGLSADAVRHDTAFYHDFDRAIHWFLADAWHPGAKCTCTFDVGWLTRGERHWGEKPQGYRAFFPRLASAIASGELTEEEFKNRR